jgi:hypothetical protein
MSTTEVTIHPWDDPYVDEILENHIVNIKFNTSRGPNDLLKKCILDLLPKHLDWFVTYLFSIVGMEVEGQEISLGIVYVKEDTPDFSGGFKFAKLGRWVKAQKTDGLHLGMEGFSDFRRIVRKLRSDLIGWAPGGFLEPVLILTSGADGKPHIQDVRIISKKIPHAFTAHAVYKDLTNDNHNSFVIWVKTAGSIRVYRRGKFLGQIMRLRDAGGWTTRSIDRMVEIVQHSAKIAGMNIEETVCRSLIVEPSVAISESRRGTSIVVIEEATFNTLESNWNVPGELVACKAKHAPLIYEQEDTVTESEYENYLAQDGALVISPEGKLLGMGTYFQGGPGGRRDTAAWLPKVIEKCITIVTSQDGPIYLHWAEGEKGKKRGEGVRLDFIPTSDSNPIQLDPEKEQEDVVVGVPDIETA